MVDFQFQQDRCWKVYQGEKQGSPIEVQVTNWPCPGASHVITLVKQGKNSSIHAWYAQLTGGAGCSNKWAYHKASKLQRDCRKDCTQVFEKTDRHAQNDRTCFCVGLAVAFLTCIYCKISFLFLWDCNRWKRGCTHINSTSPLYMYKSIVDMEAVYDWYHDLYIFTWLYKSSTELRSWSSSMDNFLKALDSSVYLVTTCLYRSCNCLTSPGLKVSVSEFMKGNLAPVVYQFEQYDHEQ